MTTRKELAENERLQGAMLLELKDSLTRAVEAEQAVYRLANLYIKAGVDERWVLRTLRVSRATFYRKLK